MNEIIYPKEFYKGRLAETKILVENNRYLSFLPMSVLIEVIGKIKLNNNDWFDDRCKYFNDGLKEMGLDYFKHKDLLYNNLRCAFAHTLLVNNRIELTGKDEAEKQTWLHLKTNENDRLVLIAETLFKDIEKTLNNLLNKEYDSSNKMCKSVLDNTANNDHD